MPPRLSTAIAFVMALLSFGYAGFVLAEAALGR